jgi:pimeloyl-ACP methyl ester carboxylesterase
MISHTESKIIIPTKSGKLVGILHKKSDTTLMVICHGFGGSKDHASIKRLADALWEKGFSVFRFDFSGVGESDGSFMIHLDRQVQDVSDVLSHFRAYKKIILVGGSLGALSATLATLQYANVSALVTINGFFGSPALDVRHKALYYGWKVLAGTLPSFQRDNLLVTNLLQPEHISVPVLVICTKNDRVVDYRQSVDFYGQLKTKKKLEILPLEKHNLKGTHDIALSVNAIVHWKQ